MCFQADNHMQQRIHYTRLLLLAEADWWRCSKEHTLVQDEDFWSVFMRVTCTETASASLLMVTE